MTLLLHFVISSLLASRIAGFPGVLPGPDARSLLGLPELVDGILGSVATAIDPENKRPDAAHPYQAPGPTDQRGPCPGLNALANHGYISRSGIVTGGEVIRATSEGFNMAADLSGLLVLINTAFGGNIVTGTFSIGGEDNRTYSAFGPGSRAAGRQFGLDAHSRCEADVSATKEDFFLNDGDNHSGIGSRFARFTQLAAAHGGQYSVDAANQLYGQNAILSLAKNPRLYQNGYTLLVTLGEYPFIPNFFGNGTYGAGGVANYESISSFLGFKLDESTGEFCYVPERFPDVWYRRALPYDFTQFALALAPTFLNGPPTVPNPLGAVLTNPAELPQLECAIYQAVFSAVIEAFVGSTVEQIIAVTAYLQANLLPLIPSTLGCPILTNGTTGSQPQTQDSLQETRPGGGQAYGVCSA